MPAMPVMPPIDVVSDASVALKWFHAEGEEEVEPSRGLIGAYEAQTVALQVLDLTAYEIGNALLRGRTKATPSQVNTVLQSLSEICPATRPGQEDFGLAAEIAARHGLTFYDAVYAAVAQRRHARLATLDQQLLDAALGMRPSEIPLEPAAPPTPRRKRLTPGSRSAEPDSGGRPARRR